MRAGFTIAAMAVCLMMPAQLSADDTKTVTAEGRAVLGDDRTLAEARAIALNNARRNALESAVGVTVKSSTVLYNSELIEDLVVAATRGLIVKEEILGQDCETASGGALICTARIIATVKSLNQSARPSIEFLRASVSRPESAGSIMSAPVFQDGDELQVHATLAKPAHLNIFSVDQLGGVAQLYPNAYVEDRPVQAGLDFVFPTDDLRQMGLRLRVSPLKGMNSSVESVLIIATSQQRNFLARSKTGESATITDLMAELSELDPSAWAQKTLGYEVRR